MTTRSAPLRVRIVTTAALTVAAVAGFSSPASAGGWAMASLDSMPAAEQGGTAEVSFTILQHGVTPVDLDEGVGIRIHHHEGGTAFFPAARDGAVGHYVAAVTFPDTAGAYEWEIQMGWFGPHELGTLDVRAAEDASLATWSNIRWLTLGGSLLLAGIAVVDLAASRRRRLAIG